MLRRTYLLTYLFTCDWRLTAAKTFAQYFTCNHGLILNFFSEWTGLAVNRCYVSIAGQNDVIMTSAKGTNHDHRQDLHWCME